MPGKDYDRWTEVAENVYIRNPASYPGFEEGVKATKGAVEAALAHGLDLSMIEGTGLNGKITKADVEAAVSA